MKFFYKYLGQLFFTLILVNSAPVLGQARLVNNDLKDSSKPYVWSYFHHVFQVENCDCNDSVSLTSNTETMINPLSARSFEVYTTARKEITLSLWCGNKKLNDYVQEVKFVTDSKFHISGQQTKKISIAQILQNPSFSYDVENSPFKEPYFKIDSFQIFHKRASEIMIFTDGAPFVGALDTVVVWDSDIEEEVTIVSISNAASHYFHKGNRFTAAQLGYIQTINKGDEVGIFVYLSCLVCEKGITYQFYFEIL